MCPPPQSQTDYFWPIKTLINRYRKSSILWFTAFSPHEAWSLLVDLKALHYLNKRPEKSIIQLKAAHSFGILSVMNDLLSKSGQNCVIELEGLSFILTRPLLSKNRGAPLNQVWGQRSPIPAEEPPEQVTSLRSGIILSRDGQRRC